MDGIPPELIAAVCASVDGLKQNKASSTIGFNDMAITIAFGHSEYGTPTVNASNISDFLNKNPAVPNDARMKPDVVQQYLNVLNDSHLIEEQKRQDSKNDYIMRGDVSSIIVSSYKKLKSPEINDALFHGFRVYGGLKIIPQKKIKR